MLLTPNTSRRKYQRERLVLGAWLILLSLVVGGFWWLSKRPTQSPAPGRMACDAERVRGDHFINGDFRFAGADYQSLEQARSGRYSLRLPMAQGAVYGFDTRVEGVRPGEVYEISVWRKGGGGALAVGGEEPSGFYQQTGQVTETEGDGWSQLRLRFHIPFQSGPTILHVYVFSDGAVPVFFDDLLIRRINQWEGAGFQPTRLRLEMDNQALNQLSRTREEAFLTGVLQTGGDDWVDARIQTDSSGALPVKVRLKGDWLDHLRGDKWSFRLKMKDGNAWRRLTVFSLHTPAARYHLHEWLLHQLWEKEDVLTTRYDLVELLVNGESRGIYAYEEHFSKELVEFRARREGPVVKYVEDGYWAGIARQLTHHGFIRPGSGHSAMAWANAPIEAFEDESWQADSLRYPLLAQAYLLLDQYRSGALPAADVFDLERMARYLAACDLLNAYHGLSWHNQRFYYNPLNGRLEPIGYDAFDDAPPPRFRFLAEGATHPDAEPAAEMMKGLLQDTAFVRTYLSTLDRMSRPDYWDGFFKEIEGEWLARLSWLQMEFPDYQPVLEDFRAEVAFVRSHFWPFAENALRMHQMAEGRLRVENTHTLPLVLLGYGQTDRGMTQRFREPRWLAAASVREAWRRSRSDSLPADFASLQFSEERALAYQTTVPPAAELSLPAAARYLYYSLPGIDSLFASSIHRAPSLEELPAVLPYRQASRALDFPDLRWSESARTVTIPPGKHRLTRDLIVAPGYTLRLSAGAQVDLLSGAAIISYGPVRALGTDERPIVFLSSDGTGQGLQVISARDGSRLDHVYFSGLRNLARDGWALTGAVTFYESALVAKDCLFQDNQSEDALNLVRCEFKLSNCIWRRTSSDGFDSDFCKGELIGCIFEETTNDGLDFSGSIVTVRDGRFLQCGDKGISAGEESDLTVIDTYIADCPIGLAAKDLSVIYARGLRLEGCEQGLVAFQKKPEYGPARILVESYTANNLGRLYQIAPGSRLQLEQQLIQ